MNAKNMNNKNNESWFVLCDVTELHLWRESDLFAQLETLTQTPATQAEKVNTGRRCRDVSPLWNDLLQDSRRKGDRGAD